MTTAAPLPLTELLAVAQQHPQIAGTSDNFKITRSKTSNDIFI